MNTELAKAILDWLKSESDARLLQTRVIVLLSDDDDISKMRDAYADEDNHILIGEAMLKKYNGGISASPDGAVAAIKEIISGIESASKT